MIKGFCAELMVFALGSVKNVRYVVKVIKCIQLAEKNLGTGSWLMSKVEFSILIGQ